VKGLRQKLVQKKVPAEEADGVIERLKEAGLIDDAKYAMAFARSKLLGSGASARRVRQELARKGVSGELADDAVEQVVADEEIDTRTAVERAARKKLATMDDVEPLVQRRRLYGFLARKGYDLDEIQSVVQSLFANAR
jgi:regulatory protein